MNVINLMYLCLGVLLLIRLSYSTYADKTKYLNKALKRTQQEIKNELRSIGYFKDVDVLIDIGIKEKDVQGYYQQVHCINGSILLIDKYVYDIKLANDRFLFQKVENLMDIQKFLFIRYFKYEDNFVIFASCYNGEWIIYQTASLTRNWELSQRVNSSTPVVDAQFYLYQDALHLVLTHHAPNDLGETIVYKWDGVKFEKIDEILTRHILKVFTFSNKESEIIVLFSDSLTYRGEGEIIVIDFTDKHLKRIQTLSCSSSRHNLLYSFNNQKYILTFNEMYNGDTYLWNGQLFNRGGDFTCKKKILKTLAVELDNATLIFVAQKRYSSPISMNFLRAWLVDRNEYSINYYKEASKQIIQLNDSRNYSGRIDIAGTVSTEEAEITSHYRSTVVHHLLLQLKDKLERISSRLALLNEQLKNLYKKNGLLSKNLVVKGNFHASTLSAKNINIKYMDGIEWVPNMWLSYTKPQTIIGQAVFKHMGFENVVVPNNTYKRFQYRRDINAIKKFGTVKSLSANNIKLSTLNGHPFKDVYLQTKPKIIKGVKEFSSLSTYNLKVSYLNKMAHYIREKLSYKLLQRRSTIFNFGPALYIKNLDIQQINGFDWDSIRYSVFRRGLSRKITGELTLKNSGIQVRNLRAKMVANIYTEHLLTKSTDQTVYSSLYFDSIIAREVSSNEINNIKFEKDVATIENCDIKGPVKIHSAIVNNMHINGLSFIQYRNKTINIINNMQMYNKRVTINGNLYVSSLSPINNSIVRVNNMPFNNDVFSEYWSKTKNQKIPVNVYFKEAVSAPHILSDHLNGVPTSSYMINNSIDIEDFNNTDIVFKDVEILGNVSLNPALKHVPNIKELEMKSIRAYGKQYIMFRSVSVQGNVIIKNLVTKYLDTRSVSNALYSSYSGVVSGHKKFTKLVIKNDLISEGITAPILNNRKLKDITSTALFVDKSYDFDTLHFSSVKTQDLITSYINQISLIEYANQVENIYNLTDLNKMIIKGNLKIKGVDKLEHINSCDVKTVLPENGVFHIAKNVIIGRPVVSIHLNVKNVNQLDFVDLTKRILHKSNPQTITGMYNFHQLSSTSLFATQINGISMENLINIRSVAAQNFRAPGGITLVAPKFMKSLTGRRSSVNDLAQTLTDLKYPARRFWNHVHVSGNLVMENGACDLGIILKNAIDLNEDVTITAPITFQQNISAETVRLQEFVNGIDINAVYADAVMKNTTAVQIITGRTQFLTVSTTKVVAKDPNILLVNGLDITGFNQNIIRKSNLQNKLITGKKYFFYGIETNKIITNKISNINPRHIMSYKSISQYLIDKAIFHSLDISNDLNVQLIHGINVSNVLSNRLYCGFNAKEAQDAFGTYYIEKVAINGPTSVTTINGLDVNDIVFDVGLPIIYGEKTFRRPLVVNSSIQIDIYNNNNLSESFIQAIYGSDNAVIRGSMTFKKVATLAHGVRSDIINGNLYDYIVNTLRPSKYIKQVNTLSVIDKTKTLIKKIYKVIKGFPSTYLYLEKIDNVLIDTENAVSARVRGNESVAIFNLIRKDRVALCKLPRHSGCKCFTEQIIQITEKTNISISDAVSIRKLFVYEDKRWNITVVSNTTSYSHTCKVTSKSASNEFSRLYWDHLKSRRSGENPLHGQFIMDVQYFNHSDLLYMIACVPYDLKRGHHAAHCTVIQFSEGRNPADIGADVQKIHRAVVKMAVFETAQGIMLALVDNQTIPAETGIYRFNPESKQFEQIQRIRSVVCPNAVAGIATRNESFIVFSASSAPVTVFKYNPQSRKYYLHQNISFDARITGLSVFYAGDVGTSEAYICVVDKSNNFFIFVFRCAYWQVITKGKINGLQTLVPYRLNNNQYLFAVSNTTSIIMHVVRRSPN